MITPKWSIDGETYASLPARSYGGMTAPSIQRRRVKHESDGGAIWIRSLSAPNPERTVYQFTWERLNESEVSAIKAIDTATSGDALPFYYMFDSTVSEAVFYCRKEATFEPEELNEPGPDGTPRWRYTITLTEEFVFTPPEEE